jgi:pimeloyl-ACP methyl ester carboxylesterase
LKTVTADHFVPHVSTVPAIAGQLVGLHVREKARAGARGAAAGRVVLFVHGISVPSVPAFDLQHRDYSWMDYLARAGFRVYAMDLTGYGASPRPMMDDPSNVNPEHQAVIVPRPLAGPAAPNFPHQLNTIRDDWHEIDTVVEWLRARHRVRRVSLVGFSAGGPRAGGYAAQHPGKIDRVVLYAPAPTIAGLRIPERTEPGFPMNLQTRADLEQKRWDPDVRCPGQVERGIRDVVWQAIMAWDRVGAGWGPREGVMRYRMATRFGWTPELAGKVRAPTLVVAGEYDRLAERRAVYDQLGARDKVFLPVACASHWMCWEAQHPRLHAASAEWLGDGRLRGLRHGEARVERDGRFTVNRGR